MKEKQYEAVVHNMRDFTRNFFQSTALILLLLCTVPLGGQENSDSELTETEKQQLAAEAHEKTGLELYYQYNLAVHIPGWAFSARDYDLGTFDITMPGINISYVNICLGMDMDFGTPKRVLKNMGIGVAMEWNVLDSWNMDGYDATLFQSFSYLYYHEETKRFTDYYFKAGLGRASFSNGEILNTREEEDGSSPSGAMLVMEMGSVYPYVKNFRISSGISYKFISIQTKNIHLIAPYIRVGYRF